MSSEVQSDPLSLTENPHQELLKAADDLTKLADWYVFTALWIKTAFL